MISKRFDRKLYEENDKKAKQAVIKLLKPFKKYKVIENPKRTGVDLQVFEGEEHKFNIECEIKKVVDKMEPYPWDTVNFLNRKAKYCNLDKPTIFIIFNKNLTEYLVVKDKTVLSSSQEIVKNKYVFDGELFYKVPIDKVSVNNIKSVVQELEKVI